MSNKLLEIKDLYHIRDLHGALKATLILTTTPVKETDLIGLP